MAKKNPGRIVTFYDLGAIFGEAYKASYTTANAISGSKVTGIADCDMSVFTDDDFLPASVTELEEVVIVPNAPNVQNVLPA